MQRVIVIFFSLFFLVTACAKRKPSGILSESKMEEMMYEAHIVDAYLHTLPIDSSKKVMRVLYNNLFKKYDLDSAGFIANLDYYLGNPILLEKVYDNISNNLQVKDKEYRTIDSINSAIHQDSINRAYVFSVREQERYRLRMQYIVDCSPFTLRQQDSIFQHYLKWPTDVTKIREMVIIPPIVVVDTTASLIDSTASQSGLTPPVSPEFPEIREQAKPIQNPRGRIRDRINSL